MTLKHETEHDRHLWCAVIEQALDDATSPTASRRITDDAIEWLTKPNKNFNEVCALAGLDADWIRGGAIVALSKSKEPKASKRAKAFTADSRLRGRQLTFEGRTMNIGQWAKTIGIPAATLQSRLNLGWPVEAALTVQRWKRHRGVVSNFPDNAEGPAGVSRARSDLNRVFSECP